MAESKFDQGGVLPSDCTEAPAWLVFRNGEKILHSDGTVSVVEVRKDRTVLIKPTEDRWK